VAGTFAYSPASGTVLFPGARTLSVTFTPTDTTDYSSAKATVPLPVSKALLTVTANNVIRNYDTANGTLTGTITGFVNGDAQSVVSGAAVLTTSATLASAVGSYPIAAAQGTLAAANYTFKLVNGTLTITDGILELGWPMPGAITYGTALSTKQLDDIANVPGTFVYTPAAGTVLPGGLQTLSVTFTPTDTTDYSAAKATVQLTVNKAVLTVTANNASRAYGAANPTVTTTITGFQNGDPQSVVSGAPVLTPGAALSSPAGSYAIEVGQGTLSAANYTFKLVNGTLTIFKATLTVTASNAHVAYNQPLPGFTYTETGFKNGDSSSSLGGSPTETTTAKQGSLVGTYPIAIAQGTLAATNYSFAFKSGTLTIEPIGQAAAPVFKPAAGAYSKAQTVTLSDTTPATTFYYTTNGAAPTTASTRYTSAGIAVSATETVKAIAVAAGYTQSATATATYTIN
jgi:hypothetical protein